MRIALDMDGVLADFSGHALANLPDVPEGFEPTTWEWPRELGYTMEAFWEEIDQVEGFFASIPPYPWIYDLIEEVERYDPNWIICTSPGWKPENWSGKCEWIRDHIEKPRDCRPHTNHVVMTNDKTILRPDIVLIDDCDQNVEARTRAITFPQPWNKASKALFTEPVYGKVNYDARMNWVQHHLRAYHLAEYSLETQLGILKGDNE